MIDKEGSEDIWKYINSYPNLVSIMPKTIDDKIENEVTNSYICTDKLSGKKDIQTLRYVYGGEHIRFLEEYIIKKLSVLSSFDVSVDYFPKLDKDLGSNIILITSFEGYAKLLDTPKLQNYISSTDFDLDLNKGLMLKEGTNGLATFKGIPIFTTPYLGDNDYIFLDKDDIKFTIAPTVLTTEDSSLVESKEKCNLYERFTTKIEFTLGNIFKHMWVTIPNFEEVVTSDGLKITKLDITRYLKGKFGGFNSAFLVAAREARNNNEKLICMANEKTITNIFNTYGRSCPCSTVIINDKEYLTLYGEVFFPVNLPDNILYLVSVSLYGGGK